jgi:hypothetical protein
MAEIPQKAAIRFAKNRMAAFLSRTILMARVIN